MTLRINARCTSRRLPLVCALALASGSLASVALAGPITLESKTGTGGSAVQGNNNSSQAVIAPNGHWMIFRTTSTNLADGSNGQSATRIIKRNIDGGGCELLNGIGVFENPPLSGERVMSGDSVDPAWRGGSQVFWTNTADQTPSGFFCIDNNGVADIYRNQGAPPGFSVGTGAPCGLLADGASGKAALNWDSSVVVFQSYATVFTTGDTGICDIIAANTSGSKSYSKKSVTGNVLSGVQAANGNSFNPDIGGGENGADTVYVFESLATNLAGVDSLGHRDIFARVEPSGFGFPYTERVSVSSTGGEPNGDSYTPSISRDGRYVVYSSYATNIAGLDTNARYDIYMRDRVANTNKRVSIALNGAQPDGDCFNPKISADGKWVVFESNATNLIPLRATPAGISNIYLYHVASGTLTLVSYDFNTYAYANANSNNATITSDGRQVMFDSLASNLVTGDVGGKRDIFRFTLEDGAIANEDSCGPLTPTYTQTIPTLSGTTLGATATPGLNPLTCGDSAFSADVYYKFTASCDGQYSFDTQGSNFDTAMQIYASCGGAELACNDDWASPQRWSKVVLSMTKGQQVVVRIAGYAGAVGDYVLNTKYVSGAPANDSSLNPTPVSIGSHTFVNCGATTDGPGLTACGSPSNAYNDVWFRFTAPTSGAYVVGTCDASFDSILSVYAAASGPVTSAQQIACNDDNIECNQGSRLPITVVGGQQYLIRVASYNPNAMGDGHLVINRVGCSPADIADDAGNAPPQGTNGGVNEGDYNAFFQGFFNNSPACDIADDQGTPLPPYGNPGGSNGGVNEGDYNCFFQYFFSGCLS